ncbi:hypothetical protein C922_05075 [Plasmodium inui San Antonio 1]|uniref:Uncharacterized protein n=1 Tax=Plasmodium inui San Antonio 1 TaxID=1237626 RepID=W7A664_9APIC|nr:hypothetical protein C922_05075 [Plasmodium inui San Antonio 1]EUD64559.1 hypothetical protein C922_05075 [Plasmodium inui San Antonio 1]
MKSDNCPISTGCQKSRINTRESRIHPSRQRIRKPILEGWTPTSGTIPQPLEVAKDSQTIEKSKQIDYQSPQPHKESRNEMKTKIEPRREQNHNKSEILIRKSRGNRSS